MTILTLSFTAPATASAAAGYASELMALPEGEITINYSQGVLYINGIPKGCYIVKVGSVVRKIAVR